MSRGQAKAGKSDRSKADWETIEREYRAGQLSIREIERQFGVSDTAIKKRAKKHGWSRDLAARVRQKAEEKLAVEAAGGSGNVDAQEIVEKAAERAAEVVREHRTDIKAARILVQRLLGELLAATSHPGEMEAMIETDTAGGRDQKRRNALMRAVSLPSRAGVIRDLSAALKNLIPLERQAFSLDDKEKGPQDHAPLEERLKTYQREKLIEESPNVTRLH